MYVGVDGCRAGWLAVAIDPRGVVSSRLESTLVGLIGALSPFDLMLIDMPIGLPSANVPERGCDTAARRLLGARRSSVFPVPSRAALAATDYRAACEINEAELGKRLSKQTWHIAGKIRELDELLAGQSGLPIREMHPEVAFQALNGGEPLAASKKTREGHAERLRLLAAALPGARSAARAIRRRHPLRQQLADDDILDALVGATIARHGDALDTLPASPWRDEHGLVMEIVIPPAAPGRSLRRLTR